MLATNAQAIELLRIYNQMLDDGEKKPYDEAEKIWAKKYGKRLFGSKSGFKTKIARLRKKGLIPEADRNVPKVIQEKYSVVVSRGEKFLPAKKCVDSFLLEAF